MTKVVVYGTAWCEQARGLRIYLTQQRVLHDFVNVDLVTEGAAALTLEAGQYHAPVVVVGERILKNPVLSVLERELRKRGLLGERLESGGVLEPDVLS